MRVAVAGTSYSKRDKMAADAVVMSVEAAGKNSDKAARDYAAEITRLMKNVSANPPKKTKGKSHGNPKRISKGSTIWGSPGTMAWIVTKKIPAKIELERGAQDFLGDLAAFKLHVFRDKAALNITFLHSKRKEVLHTLPAEFPSSRSSESTRVKAAIEWAEKMEQHIQSEAKKGRNPHKKQKKHKRPGPKIKEQAELPDGVEITRLPPGPAPKRSLMPGETLYWPGSKAGITGGTRRIAPLPASHPEDPAEHNPPKKKAKKKNPLPFPVGLVVEEGGAGWTVAEYVPRYSLVTLTKGHRSLMVGPVDCSKWSGVDWNFALYGDYGQIITETERRASDIRKAVDAAAKWANSVTINPPKKKAKNPASRKRKGYKITVDGFGGEFGYLATHPDHGVLEMFGYTSESKAFGAANRAIDKAQGLRLTRALFDNPKKKAKKNARRITSHAQRHGGPYGLHHKMDMISYSLGTIAVGLKGEDDPKALAVLKRGGLVRGRSPNLEITRKGIDALHRTYPDAVTFFNQQWEDGRVPRPVPNPPKKAKKKATSRRRVDNVGEIVIVSEGDVSETAEMIGPNEWRGDGFIDFPGNPVEYSVKGRSYEEVHRKLRKKEKELSKAEAARCEEPEIPKTPSLAPRIRKRVQKGNPKKKAKKNPKKHSGVYAGRVINGWEIFDEEVGRGLDPDVHYVMLRRSGDHLRVQWTGDGAKGYPSAILYKGGVAQPGKKWRKTGGVITDIRNATKWANSAQSNPKKKAKKKTASPAKALVTKCQKAWDHYCERPGRKRLKEVFAHLEKMEKSTAKTVRDELRRCKRSAKAEAKRLGIKV